MSHTVQIDYSKIGLQCQSVCDIAEKRLTELEDMVKEIDASSTRLQNSQTEFFHEQLREEAEILRKKLHDVQNKALAFIEIGVKNVYEGDPLKNEIVIAAKELQKHIDQLSLGKIQELSALLDTILSDRIQENQQALLNRSNGPVGINEQISNLLATISDEVLRQFTYLAYLKNPSLTGNELLDLGKKMKTETIADRENIERERIRAELEASRISHKKIDEILSSQKTLVQAQNEATTELVEEQVRKKSLSIIKKAITARGFIVEKKNIKIDTDKNEVTMVALKPSGERATFTVFLDGRFIYDFHGYEGQACQKDIGPFMNDLEEVYGIHVTAQNEIWSNPDKISTMKYQAINTNKNRR